MTPFGEVAAATPSGEAEPIVRPRLLGVLRRRWSLRLVAVIGGAGFGKSTLLVQAIEDNRRDRAGMDVLVLCPPGAEAASTLARAIGDALGLDLPPTSEAGGLAAALADSIAARAPLPICLILDDVHHLRPGTPAEALLAQLVELIPTNGHLVVASRPALPSIGLPDLVSTGAAAVIDEEALTLTADEVSEVARRSAVDPRALSDAGGWPALVGLAAVAGHAAGGERLWAEIVDGLEPGRRRALTVLALLGRADRATLAAALGEDADPLAVVEGLPLVRVGPDDRVDVHALWRGPLDGVLPDAELDGVLRRAARHLADEGDPVAAFDLLLRCTDDHAVLELVRDVCTQLRPPVGADVLDGWREQLSDRLGDVPEVSLLDATARVSREEGLEQVPSILCSAADAFRAQGSHHGLFACVVHRYAFGFLTRDADLQVAAVIDGFALIDAGYAPAVHIGALGRAGLCVVAHDYRGALNHLDDVEIDHLDEAWRATWAWMYGEQLLSLGRPADALERFAPESFRTWARVSDRLWDGTIQALFHQGRVDEAIGRARSQLDARAGHQAREVQPLQALLTRLLVHAGRLDEARPILRAALGAGPPTELVTTQMVLIAEALVAIEDDDEAAAGALLAKVSEPDLHMFRRAVAVHYVLMPQWRSYWDDHHLEGTFATARQIAAALVAAREDLLTTPLKALGRLPAATLRSVLPPRWVAEWLVYAESAGVDTRPLTTELGSAGRNRVEELADGEHHVPAVAAQRLLSRIPGVPDEVVDVRLLGRPELRHGDATDVGRGWRRRRVRELLAYLVLHPTARRDAAGDALWPDLNAQSVANNLRVTLTHLLKALEPDRRPHDASYFLEAVGSTLTLKGRDRLRVDVWDMARHLEAARHAEAVGSPSEARAAFDAARACWGGPFLQGEAPSWADLDADRLLADHLHATVRSGELALAAGDRRAAEARAHEALAVSTWSEPAHRLLIGVRLAGGDHAGASAALSRCLAALGELGVTAAPATRMLQRRLELDA